MKYSIFNSQNLEPCHMTDIQLNVLSGLQSINNNTLINNFSGVFTTESPDLYLEVNKSRITSGVRSGDGYYYYLGTNAFHINNDVFKRTRFSILDNSAEKLPRTGYYNYFPWIDMFFRMFSAPEAFNPQLFRNINNDVPIVTYGRILPQETIELGYSFYARCGNSGSARPEWISTMKTNIIEAIFSNNDEATALFAAWLPVAKLISGVLVEALLGDALFAKDDYLIADDNIYFQLNSNIWNTGGFYRRKEATNTSTREELLYHIYIK